MNGFLTAETEMLLLQDFLTILRDLVGAQEGESLYVKIRQIVAERDSLKEKAQRLQDDLDISNETFEDMKKTMRCPDGRKIDEHFEVMMRKADLLDKAVGLLEGCQGSTLTLDQRAYICKFLEEVAESK